MKGFKETVEALGIKFEPTYSKSGNSDPTHSKQRLLKIDTKSLRRKVRCTGDVLTCDSKKHIHLSRDRVYVHCCQCSRNNKNTK